MLEGADHVLAMVSAGFADVGAFVHGATLATNAIIERRGGAHRADRHAGLPRRAGDRRRGALRPVRPLDREAAPAGVAPGSLHGARAGRRHGGRAAGARRGRGAGGGRAPPGRGGSSRVAVSFLHAYANPDHEERVRAILAEAAPGLSVSLSSEVCPEIREWERTSTTVANAFVQPLMAGYLTRLEAALRARRCPAPLRLMTSGGHLTSVETACRHPVRLVESGPAGGAILAAHVARERGEGRVISFDMGGTTAKVCLIEDGEPLTSRAFEVDRSARFLKGSGLPLRIPVIEMIEIGAGGGSIARLDATRSIAVGAAQRGLRARAGLLRTRRRGPHRHRRRRGARADLARALRGAAPSGSTPALSGEALSREICAPLNLSREMGALGVVEIVDENMANAARVHAAERGVALSGHTLIAFGGGGAAARRAHGREAGALARRGAARRGRGLGGGLPARARGLRARPQPLPAARRLRRGPGQRDAGRHGRRGARAHRRRRGGGGGTLGVHALQRPGPRDRGAPAPSPAERGRRGRAQGGVRGRVSPPVRAPHPRAQRSRP